MEVVKHNKAQQRGRGAPGAAGAAGAGLNTGKDLEEHRRGATRAAPTRGAAKPRNQAKPASEGEGSGDTTKLVHQVGDVVINLFITT